MEKITKRQIEDVLQKLEAFRIAIENGENPIKKNYFSSDEHRATARLGYFENHGSSYKFPIWKSKVIKFEPFHARKIIEEMKITGKERRENDLSKFENSRTLIGMSKNEINELVSKVEALTKKGFSQNEIAIKLNLSPHSVQTLRYKSRQKRKDIESGIEKRNVFESGIEKQNKWIKDVEGSEKKDKARKIMLNPRKKYRIIPVYRDAVVFLFYKLQYKKMFKWVDTGIASKTIDGLKSKINSEGLKIKQ